MKSLETISCTFNIFDRGREYTGVERGYMLENFKAAIEHPFTQERIQLREAVGYLGHGIREVTKKLMPGETDVAVMDDGQSMLVKAIPGCVMTNLSMDEKGTVTHTQEILENDEGRAILGLHKSRVGGFSIAASSAVKKVANTLIDRVYGFDYVTNPNFADNRGYVMDSATGQAGESMILDSMTSCGLTEELAKKRLRSWYRSAAEADQYRDQFQQMLQLEAAMRTSYDSLLDKFNAVSNQLKAIQEGRRTEEERRRGVYREFAQRSAIALGASVLDSIATADSVEDLDNLKSLLEKTAGISGNLLPIGQQGRPEFVRAARHAPEFGSVESAPDLTMY